jgi:hypothetical protein
MAGAGGIDCVTPRLLKTFSPLFSVALASGPSQEGRAEPYATAVSDQVYERPAGAVELRTENPWFLWLYGGTDGTGA